MLRKSTTETPEVGISGLPANRIGAKLARRALYARCHRPTIAASSKQEREYTQYLACTCQSRMGKCKSDLLRKPPLAQQAQPTLSHSPLDQRSHPGSTNHLLQTQTLPLHVEPPNHEASQPKSASRSQSLPTPFPSSSTLYLKNEPKSSIAPRLHNSKTTPPRYSLHTHMPSSYYSPV